jgi:hypothetical protein
LERYLVGVVSVRFGPTAVGSDLEVRGKFKPAQAVA